MKLSSFRGAEKGICVCGLEVEGKVDNTLDFHCFLLTSPIVVLTIIKSWGEWIFLPSLQGWIWVLRDWNNINKKKFIEGRQMIIRICTNLCRLFKVSNEK